MRKKVYRLGVKVALSFDGDDELAEVMDEWEKTSDSMAFPAYYAASEQRG